MSFEQALPIFLNNQIYFPEATNDNSFFTTLKKISSRIINSHELVDVVNERGVPGLELLLSGHLYHLILIRSVSPVVAVLAVVVVAVEPEPFAQTFLLLGGNLGVFHSSGRATLL